MTDILRLRARRFHALTSFLRGETRATPPRHTAIPDHPARDVGVPNGARSSRFVRDPVIQMEKSMV